MKRDMDLARNLLLEIEGGRQTFEPMPREMAMMLGEDGAGMTPHEQAERIAYHLDTRKNLSL